MSLPRFAAVLFTAAVMASSPLTAAAQSNAPVTWSDLDVSTPEGAAELDSRINASARRACRSLRTTGSNRNPISFCRDEIREGVLRRMDEPTREAYNRARSEGRRGDRN